MCGRDQVAALVATVVLMVIMAVGGISPALGHEQRDSAGFQLVVGWGDEPAYTGLRNSVQVTISEADGAPVTDAAGSLEVEVSKGTDRMTLPLEGNLGEGGLETPGDYRAWLVPTRPGTYTFRVIGTIRDQPVDEPFTSSEDTFDEVRDVASIQFPAQNPSTGELATRIERELPRAVEAGLRERDDRMDNTRTLALVGVVTGTLGLLSAAGALVATNRRASLRP